MTFESPKLAAVQSPQPVPRQVFVSQVTTETEFLQRSRELQAALQSGSFNNYCQNKIQTAKTDAEQDIWKFLLVRTVRLPWGLSDICASGGVVIRTARERWYSWHLQFAFE